MHLENLLKNFPHVSLATHENNKEILEFFSRFNLKNNAELVHYDRHPDFFGLLKARGHNSLTFVLREDDSSLQGVAVVSFRPGYINGELTTVGYLGDLRVSLNRKLIREWRNCFKAFIENSSQMKETGGCCHFQTALMDDNADSRATLASNKISGVHYEKLMSYHMVNVIGSLPHPHHLSNLVLEKAEARDHNSLVEFLNNCSQHIPFGHDWNQELPHRFKNWPGYSYQNFLISKDKEGKIVGAISYYDPSPLKTMSLSKIPTEVKLLKKLTGLLPLFNQCPLPKEGKSMEVLYLERPFCGSGLKATQLVHKAIQELLVRECHMIAFTDWPKASLADGLKGFFTHITPMALYSVHPLKDRVPLYLFPKLTTPPQFDMAMV